jgi:hypothetical protein
MARNVTLTELLSRVKGPGEYRDPPFTDALITTYINSGWAQLWSMITEMNEQWNIDTENISVLSGTAEYSLDADWYRSIGFDMIMPDGRRVPLERCQFSERHKDYWYQGVYKEDTQYMLLNKKVEFVPEPNFNATVSHLFTPAYPILGDGTGTTVTSVDGHNDWVEWVVFYAWRLCALREESSTADLVAMMEDVERRIRVSMTSPDGANPAKVRDMYAERAMKRAYGRYVP